MVADLFFDTGIDKHTVVVVDTEQFVDSFVEFVEVALVDTDNAAVSVGI